jgi:predicted nucleic acid-binding Zn ribbon protein
MPIYTFRNNETGEEFDETMGISELDTYLESNSHIEQLITSGTKIVHERGTNLRVDDGFRESIAKVKETYKINNIKSY